MKKTLVAIAALMLAAAAHAQGTLNFNNRISGVFDAPAVLADGTTGAGTVAGIVAQLFLVNGSTLTPVGSAISFRGNSGALAKYFDGGTLTVPGAAVGSSPTLRVRAWVGANFDGAQTRGESANFTAGPLGGDNGSGAPPALPADLLNLKGFTVTTIPEPTTIALGLLGGVALLAARRRK